MKAGDRARISHDQADIKWGNNSEFSYLGENAPYYHILNGSKPNAQCATILTESRNFSILIPFVGLCDDAGLGFAEVSAGGC